MADTMPFKRLILRAVLRHVSPIVIRLISVSDHLPIDEFHDVFRAILGWTGDLGYIIRVHGQEFNSFGARRGRRHYTSQTAPPGEVPLHLRHPAHVGVQDFVVMQQVYEEVERRRKCPHCGGRYTTKDCGSTPVSTVFGRVEVPAQIGEHPVLFL
jgi:hypothetical protein